MSRQRHLVVAVADAKPRQRDLAAAEWRARSPQSSTADLTPPARRIVKGTDTIRAEIHCKDSA